MTKKYIKQTGYTITELMIVLAISGSMVVTAYSTITGQRDRNEFSQSVRDFETQITDVANDVVKGYFPNFGGNQECEATASSGITFSAGPIEQGGSEDCIFAGKSLNVATGTDDLQLQTLVARRVQASGDEIYSLDDLSFRDIRAASWLDDEVKLTNDLNIDNVTHGSAPGTSVGSVVFLSSFASRSGNGSGQLSGAPTADVRWISTTDGLAGLESPSSYKDVDDTDGIRICVSRGDGRQALIYIGQNSSLLSTRAEFDVSC